MDRLERDFYGVEETPEGKKIHVYGYCYFSGDTQDDGKEYRHLEFCHFWLPIGFTQSLYDSEYSRCKQYIDDCDEEEIVDVMGSYEAIPFPMRDVSHSTPCGMYIDC